MQSTRERARDLWTAYYTGKARFTDIMREHDLHKIPEEEWNEERMEAKSNMKDKLCETDSRLFAAITGELEHDE